MKKISKEEAQLTLQNALLETDKKRIGIAYQPLDSVKSQLEYLLDALERKNDRQKLCDITLGRYAAYEFEPTDPDYASALYQASNVASLLLKNRL